MSVTKNIRDGRLFIVGGQPATRTVSYTPSLLRQGASVYRFELYSTEGTYYVRRWVSNNALDFNSVSPSTVMTLTTDPVGDFQVVRESANVWYMYLAIDGGSSHHTIYISKSTNQGATWSAPTEIVEYGDAWSSSAIRSPGVGILGTRRVMVAAGNGDKLAIYYCAVADNPETPANWKIADGNPIYDSPFANVTVTAMAGQDGRLYAYWTQDETNGGDRTYQRVAEITVASNTYTLGTPRKVGFYATGAASEFYRGDSYFDSVLGLYVHTRRLKTGAPCRTWVSEKPDSMWIAVPSSSPGTWTAGAYLELEIPEGGLSMTEDMGDVKIVMNRTGPDHLRRSKHGLSADLSFKPWDYDDVIDILRDGITVGQISPTQTTHVALFTSGVDGAPDEFLILPSCVIAPGFSEGADANTVKMSITCPLGIPLVGSANADCMGAAKDEEEPPE